MTVKAHNAITIHAPPTKHPTAPVRIAVNRRRPVSWLHCGVDEFLRLLALHEAGKINLLEMDTEEPDDDIEPDVDGEPLHGRTHVAGGTTFGRVLFVMQQATRPLTAKEIASMAGTNIETTRDHLSTSDAFVLVSKSGCAGLWMLKSKVTKKAE